MKEVFFKTENSFLDRVKWQYNSKIITRVQLFNKKVFQKNDIIEEKFWSQVKNLKLNGYVVTNAQTTNLTHRLAFKPYILNANFIDYIPYYPYTVGETKKIIEEIYGIDFENPPETGGGAIKDKWYKITFENRSQDEWQLLANKFNLSAIIVHNKWSLMLTKKFSSPKYTIYLLDK